jgi:hypothetical protein
LIDYTTAGTSQTGTQMTTINMPDTLSLSYSGTAPSSLAVFCPSVSYKTIYAFDSINAWYVYTTMHSGMVLDSGVIKSCWVKYGAGNSIGIPFHDSANVGLTCQMPVIDVSRYA